VGLLSELFSFRERIAVFRFPGILAFLLFLDLGDRGGPSRWYYVITVFE
jgi:hypothetical protein